MEKKDLINIIAGSVIVPVIWGGINLYIDVRDNTKDIIELKNRIHQEEPIKKQEELIKRIQQQQIYRLDARK